MSSVDSKNSNTLSAPAINGLFGVRRCHSCGTDKVKGRRKYCCRACRQRLVWKLDVASSLLRAMHTRYATFSFTPETLMLNVVASGSHDVFSFLWKRTPNKKPADDLGNLIEYLGRQWWKEHDKKGSRHQASKSVLENARTSVTTPENVRPFSIISPVVGKKRLAMLKLKKSELLGEHAFDAVKSAYRKQVLIHHPDKNGDARLFRKVHQAYEELRQWLENPVVRQKKGLFEKWSFDGARWSPPMTLPGRSLG